jgi:hypothetical protein
MEGGLIRELEMKRSCARAHADLAVVEFSLQVGTCPADESDLVCS